MDHESENEFRRIWERMKQFEEDSRTLLVLKTTMERLGKKMDTMSMLATGVIGSVLADLIVHIIHK